MVATLDTSTPGNIGLLVDEHTVGLWTFAEVAGVPCSDGAGVVDDLAPDPDGAATGPAITSSGAWAQTIARDFTLGGLVGADLAPTAEATTALTRDLTIQAVVRIPQDGTARATLVARGLGGSAAERVAFALELEQASGASMRVRLCWEDSSGSEEIDDGAAFANPGADAVVLLTATRRWESDDAVVCRYYIGADLIGESVAKGPIAGATTGHLSIGTRRVAGTYERRWASTIDELKITRHEATAEEVAATWRRLAVHQPEGAELVNALPAPGTPISGDPSSRIRRLLRLAGQGLGLAAARAEQLGDLLPTRAYGRVLDRWEAIAGLPTLGRASVEARRTRLIAHLRRKGWNTENLLDAVATLLDADPGDLEVDNFSNTYTDPFTSLRPERWHADAGVSALGWDVTGGKLRARANAADGLRFDGTNRAGMACIMPLTERSGVGLYHAARLTLTSLPSDAEAGLYLRHGYNGDHLFFGVRNTGGMYEVVSQRFGGNVARDAAPVPHAVVTSADRWLRLRWESGGPLVDNFYHLDWSADGVTYDTDLSSNAVYEPGWIGFYVRSYAVIGGALDVRFSEWLAREPQGTRPFSMYVYRDPGLGGAPAMLGASALLRRFRHAYVHAAAISSRSLLCDDTGSGCDLGPMGGI